mmetsp:Transcript_11697/g.17360  ORF Transcript_11697/g.17360 Transcript_11697/m.17360 type:complete len:125 (-) Transcript_11697:3121-3495(-)
MVYLCHSAKYQIKLNNSSGKMLSAAKTHDGIEIIVDKEKRQTNQIWRFVDGIILNQGTKLALVADKDGSISINKADKTNKYQNWIFDGLHIQSEETKLNLNVEQNHVCLSENEDTTWTIHPKPY